MTKPTKEKQFTRLTNKTFGLELMIDENEIESFWTNGHYWIKMKTGDEFEIDSESYYKLYHKHL